MKNIKWKNVSQLTYSKIVKGFKTRYEFAIQKIMRCVYSPQTGISIVVGIHAKAKWAF